ncbi:MAG: hypothetical protein HQ503_07870 [Rhodospirillales bacterium]|nr:hypothetical protein [Rhodospirillales bacterium]
MADDHDITRTDYGGKLATDPTRMAEGMMEMFGDMADMALSRIFARTQALENGFDLNAVSQTDIGRFKIGWLVGLGELMFFGMRDQAKLGEVEKAYGGELETYAAEKNLSEFYAATSAAIPGLIAADADFTERGLFNAPMSNDPDERPRNRGLGPQMAARICDQAFSKNEKLTPIIEVIGELVEAEFNNAYGHGSIACNAFEVD